MAAALALATVSIAFGQTADSTLAADGTLTAPTISEHSRRLAREAYVLGAREVDRDLLEAAEQHFTRAHDLDPANADYNNALALTREHRLTQLVQQASVARVQRDTVRADALLEQARRIDPENAVIAQHFPSPASVATAVDPTDRFHDSPVPAEAIDLTPSPSSQSFHLRADSRSVLTEVLRSFGIRAVFDDSVPNSNLRFDLEQVSYAQAIPILLSMVHSFVVPLDATSVLIAKDTPENRDRLERLLEETIYVPGSTPEQMAEIGNLLRGVFEVKQLAVRNSAGDLVVRAPRETLRAINMTVADLVSGNSEVVFDLKLYEVDRTRIRSIGPQLPQGFGVYNVASTAQSLVSANQTIIDQAIANGLITLTGNATTDLIREAVFLIASGAASSSLLSGTLGFIGGGLTYTGVTETGGASFSLSLNSSDARILDNITLRAGDRQTSTFRAGTRYPIVTGVYNSAGNVSSSALSGVTINGVSASTLLNQYLGASSSYSIPQFQYEDLGISLKATPNVTKSGEVRLHLELKIEALTGASLDNIPVLSSRQLASDITVPDGDTALLVSSLSKTEALAVTGTPGLGEIPGFQSIGAARTGEQDTGELVILVTPHIVRRRPANLFSPRIVLTETQRPTE